jgi:hypothetical protein
VITSGLSLNHKHSTLNPLLHTIRLRGPWSVEPLERFVLQPDGFYKPVDTGLPAGGRMTMPADWSDLLGPDFLGRVSYRRAFNKPTGLESGERVWLVVEAARSQACVVWKGELIGFVNSGDAADRFDITERLEDHNTLEIYVDHPALDSMRSTIGDPTQLPPGGLVGEVRLEIEETLRGTHSV